MTFRYWRLGCLLLVLAGAPAAAQVVCPAGASTWTGATDGSWSTDSNWSPPGAPGNNADVCFSTPTPSPFLPTSTVRLRNLYVLAGTSLTLNGTTGSLAVRDGIHSDGTFTFTGGSEDLQVMSPQTWQVGSGLSTIDWPVAFRGRVILSGSGDLTLNGALSGGGALIKSSSGTLLLAGTGSTHSGGITVNAGLLNMTGTLTGEGAVAINSGATLSGTGTLGSTLLTVSAGAIYLPGSAGAGTLSSNALSFDAAARLSFTVGTSSTGGAVTGALTLDGILDITAGPGFGQGTFTLFTATGAITNNALRLGTVPSGFSYDYQVSGGSVLLKVGPPATAVELAKLTAVGDGAATEITWHAGTEIRNLGYRVYREDGGRRHAVSGLIAGSALRAGFDPLAGRNYAFVDPGGRGGGRYWVEAIDLKGSSRWFGPVLASGGARSGLRSSALVADLATGALLAQGGSNALAVDPPGLDRNWRDPSLVRQWEIASSSGAVKLLVRQDGVYRVPASQLFAAGLPMGTSLATLQLWSGGRAIAFRALSADGATLQAGDALEFFGQAADTRYTDTRVYWVTHGLGAPTTIEAATATGASSSVTSFLETLEIRERSLHISALWSAQTDGFFGPLLIGTQPVTRTFSTPALDLVAPEAAVLEMSIEGLTNGDHAVDVAVNGTTVGSIEVSDQDFATGRFTLPPGLLLAGENTVSLGGRTSSEISVEISQRLTYPRLFTLDAPLRFTVQAGAHVELTGADAPDAHVLDVTSALQPLALVTEPSSGGTSLTAAGGGTRILYAYRDQDVLAPAVVADVPSSWHSAQGADLVIIGARSLLPSMRPLVDQRTAEGLTVALVDVEDVYDEFSAGEKDTLALKSFLANAARTWSTPPSFVLLAGAATYDPRGWLGHPELDQVPTVLVATRYIEAPSDDALVTFDGALGPALAIGRLPLSSAADMDFAVAKIIGRAPASKPAGSLLLVHDRDGTIDFSAASAEVRAALSGWSAQDLVRGPDDAATHAALLEALRAGHAAVDFQGHGAEDFWGGQILSTTDVDALSGTGGGTLLVAATCLNAYFVDIGRESLGSALLRTPNGGAWGVWASSALTLPTEHALLSKTLLSAALNDGLTLGEATLEAKAAVSDPDVRASFLLLGDPSARAVAQTSSALSISGKSSSSLGCSTSGAGTTSAAILLLVGLWLVSSRRRRAPVTVRRADQSSSRFRNVG